MIMGSLLQEAQQSHDHGRPDAVALGGVVAWGIGGDVALRGPAVPLRFPSHRGRWPFLYRTERVVVTWVVFDYGNVLSYSQPPEAVELLAEAAHASVAEFSPAYWKHRLEYDRAALDGPGYWRQVGATLGRSFSGAEVAELTRLDIESWLHLDPAVVALAETVAAAGYPLALLSNAPAEVAEAVAALDLAGIFQHCLFSCFLRLVKPDPGIYRAVLGRLGARPGDVIFIDDRPENVTGAAALGLRPVLFTGASEAAAELARLGVRAPGIPVPGTGSGHSG